MTKNKVVKELVNLLESWEGCKLEKKCAKEILKKLEELGMNQDYKDWEYWSKENNKMSHTELKDYRNKGYLDD